MCHELCDEDRSTLALEVLHNTCLSSLPHCRWSGELRAIAAHYQGRLILWKGQVATFLTPSWRAYVHYTNRVDRVRGYLESLVVRAALRLGEPTIPAAQQRRVGDNLWLRGAMSVRRSAGCCWAARCGIRRETPGRPSRAFAAGCRVRRAGWRWLEAVAGRSAGEVRVLQDAVERTGAKTCLWIRNQELGIGGRRARLSAGLFTW